MITIDEEHSLIFAKEPFKIFEKEGIPKTYVMCNGIREWNNNSLDELKRLLDIYQNEYKMEE